MATFSTKKNGGFSVRAKVEARKAKVGAQKRCEGLGVVISIGDFIGLQRASHDMELGNWHLVFQEAFRKKNRSSESDTDTWQPLGPRLKVKLFVGYM